MKRNTHIWQKTLVSMVVSSLLLGGCALPVEQTSSGVSMPSGWGERGDQVKISPEGVPNFSWWQRFGSTELIEMVLLASRVAMTWLQRRPGCARPMRVPAWREPACYPR